MSFVAEPDVHQLWCESPPTKRMIHLPRVIQSEVTRYKTTDSLSFARQTIDGVPMKKSTRRVVIFIAILCLLLPAGIAVVVTLLYKDPPQEVPPPNSIIVSKSGGGQYKTISGALKEAQPGMKIL